MRHGFQISFACSAAAVALLTYMMRDPPPRQAGGMGQRLVVYCAAGIRQPLEDVVAAYRPAYGVEFQTKYDGSGKLLGELRVGDADLYLAADRKYLEKARAQGLVREILPLAQQYPVIVVARGNPRGIRGLADISRSGVRLSLANPQIAAISQVVREGLATAAWEALWQRRAVERATVEEVANDVKLGAVDAGIVWNGTVAHYPQLEAVTAPELLRLRSEICIGVVATSKWPARALHFARFLAARDRGLTHFARRGYDVVAGDAWSEHPELTLYSGALNRLAVAPALQRFEQREGVRVQTVFAGCGTLVGQMKAGDRPDVYFACEPTFMEIVRQPGGLDLFLQPHDVCSTEVVIVTPRGNPRGIRSLADLAENGVRLALCDPQKSALGVVTDRLLEKHGLLSQARANVQSTAATADLCVQAVVIGGLDAAVVYRANTVLQREKLEVIGIDDAAALAVQPIAVSRETRYPQLARRLVEAILADDNRATFTEHGFQWLGGRKDDSSAAQSGGGQ